ncbi:hypothetical protein GGI20_003319 [Coemansia sp. BCRC 34301]|nr:hypothetical protein GGI20_003319 [Coemansia sp. BCRC 34301]
MYGTAFASLGGQLLPLALVLLANIFTAYADADIAAIILPLASTVWAPGKSATISYRISGSPDNKSYEIDLMAGEPDNAQLVHVFDKMAVPTTSGVNSVTVQVPATLPESKYGVRLGLPSGSAWKYSQIFTISKAAQPNDNAVKVSAPSASTTRAKDTAQPKSRSPTSTISSQEHSATFAATKPALANIAPNHPRLVGLQALAFVVMAANSLF